MTEYSFQQDPYIEGTKHGTGPYRAGSFCTNDNILPGKAVKRDAVNPNQVKTWSNVSPYDVVPALGIVVRTGGVYNDFMPSNFDGYYRPGDVVSVMFEGAISVVASVDVIAGQKVYCDAATGAFTNIANNNGSSIGVFQDTATAGSYVIIQINIL